MKPWYRRTSVIKFGSLIQGNVVAFTVLLLVLVQCTADRGGTRWETSVSPTLICPGDDVSVQWDMLDYRCLGPDCGGPTNVTITSSPNVFATGAFPTNEATGTVVVNPSQDTRFTLNANLEGRPMPTDAYDVQLILPDQIHTLPVTFMGTCDGGVPTWEAVMPHGDASERVEVVRLCNTTSEIVTFGFERSPEGALRPGECVDVSEKPDSVIRVLFAPGLILGSICTGEVLREPGSATAEITLACTPAE